jgi:hypothetical protein
VMLVSAGLAAAAYLIAHAVMFLMGGTTLPHEPRGRQARPRARTTEAPLPSTEEILASGLFGQTSRERPPAGPGPVPELPAVTGLPACGGRLVGIVVNVINPYASIAATIGSDGPLLRRASDADVEKIEPERVLLREGDGLCELRLFAGPPAAVSPIDPAQRAAGAAGAAGAIQVSADDAGADDATIERELRTVRAVPRDGGVALYGIRRGTLLDRLGLKNGDVIREVDGHPVTDLDAMLQLHTRLRAGTLEGADVILERRGERQAVRYQLR